jgi:hypothetical protein
MTGSQTVEATNALAQLTGLEVLTGPERPANISSKAIVNFNAVPGATKYYIKAFAESKSLEDMISDADDNATNDNDWFDTTNLFIHMNKNKKSGTDLAEGTTYRFAVVPHGTGSSALSADSLAYVEATPSGMPDTTNIDLSGTTGIDMSGGEGAGVANQLTFAQMNGKYQVEWGATKVDWEALGNGLPITALTFDISGQYAEGISKQIVVSGSDLSYTGFVTFDGLTNGKNYKVGVKTTNANGSSATFDHDDIETVTTRPTNFTLIAGPAVGAQDISQNGDLDISYNMNGNGIDVDHGYDSANFVFDISGMDDAVDGTNLDLDGINAETTVVGRRYIIKARALNANGTASPKELTAIVKPSKPPTVQGNSSFSDSRIHIKETTAFNKIIANFSNMATVSNGYDVTGVRVKAVYDDNTNGNSEEWSGQWMIVNDLSRDVEINLPAIIDPSNASPHTTYKLNVEPFNAVYTKDYQILDADADANKPTGYPKVMKSGLVMHTTESINVISSRLGITNLTMTSPPTDMSNSMIFTWRCDAVGTNNLELLVAEASVNDTTNPTGYKVPTWSDYKLIGEMTSVKYNADADVPSSTEMSFDLSNGTASGILLDDSTHMLMSHSKSYYFMVREKAHPGNEERAFGVSKSVPVVTDLSFSDYKSRDLITFTVSPNGAKLSSLFLLNNINPTGDYFFNVLESGAVPSSIYEKLESQVSGSIKVAIQKDQFERNKKEFPKNVLFHALAGNSAGVTLATNDDIYKNLHGTDHPYDAAATALAWAIKAEALADEAETLAATINSQVGNSNGVKNNSTPPMSPADTAAKLVREHAEFARGASDLVNAAAILNEVYTKQADDKGDNMTALEQFDLAVIDMNALRLLSA